MTNPSPKPASEQDHDRLSRWGLYLLAVVFAAFGIEGLFLTDLLLEPVELTLTSPSAYADVRAVYGGCFLALALLLLTATAQGFLGIATLLLHVPVVLAAAHQGVALLLLTFALYLAYLARRQVN